MLVWSNFLRSNWKYVHICPLCNVL